MDDQVEIPGFLLGSSALNAGGRKCQFAGMKVTIFHDGNFYSLKKPST